MSDRLPHTYHAFLTRFAVRLSGRQDLPSDAWLERRFALFERFCLPSIQLQTVGGFEWLLCFDEALAGRWVRRLEEYADECGEIVLTPLRAEWGGAEVRERVRDRLPKGTLTVITSRLDSDDALACDYVSRLREAAARLHTGAVYFDWGYNLAGGSLFVQPLLRGPFASVVWRTSSRRPLMTVADHEHEDLDGVMPAVHVGLPCAWVQVLHEDNLANTQRGMRVPRSLLRPRFALPGLDSLSPEECPEYVRGAAASVAGFGHGLLTDRRRAARGLDFVRRRLLAAGLPSVSGRRPAEPAASDPEDATLSMAAGLCPVCGTAEAADAGVVRGVDGKTYRLGSCKGCGLRSVLAAPAQVVMSEHYTDGYYAQEVLRRRPLSQRVKWLLEQSRSPAAARLLTALSIARLPSWRRGPRRMLDVGCGDGATLLRASRLGWRPEGCEVSEEACAAARARGFTCHAGEWWSQLPAGAYGLLNLHHVLEHLPEPAVAFDGLRRAVAPDGLLLLGLPNWDCSLARSFGPQWWATKAPEHVWQFEFAHVTRLLEERGFRVDEVLCQNVILATLRPAVLRAQWRTARGAGWSGVRVLAVFGRGAGIALWHCVAGTGPVPGEGFAYVLHCRAAAGED